MPVSVGRGMGKHGRKSRRPRAQAYPSAGGNVLA